METDGEIKEAIMLAEMREKAIMDEQSILKAARKEGKIEGLMIKGITQLIRCNAFISNFLFRNYH